MSSVDITDNTGEFKEALERAMARALEIIGGKAETYAKGLTPTGTVASTHVEHYIGGTLRNSITHRVDEDTVLVGTNVEYAPYVELGTGKEYQPPPEWIEHNAKRGSGRDRWFWQDMNGDWHVGYPRKGVHMLQQAMENHLDEYKNVIDNELTNA